MLNDALYYKPYEIIGGEKFMAAAANPLHNSVMGRLYNIISMYLYQYRNGYVFTDNVDVHLPDGNIFRPDLTVIKSENAGIINWNGAIYGVPDMVVEVLSKSTKRKDFGVKKDIYESNGVKEYWIVDTWAKSVTVYLLRDGKFELEDEYFKFDADDLTRLDDEEKAAIKHEIKVSIFDDLYIKVDDIFSWGYED